MMLEVTRALRGGAAGEAWFWLPACCAAAPGGVSAIAAPVAMEVTARKKARLLDRTLLMAF
jgi:hypothetical protein